MPAKILLTAFKPFLQHTENSSEILLHAVASESPELATAVLPVSFENAFHEFQTTWKTRGPLSDVVLLGQAADRNSISLERVALNWKESKALDNDGKPAPGQRLLKDAPDSYLVDFFPSSWVEELNKIAPTQSSFSAGTYVCNTLYFQVVHFLRNTPTRVIFVHVPLLEKIPLEKQKAVLHSLLDLLQSSRNS